MNFDILAELRNQTGFWHKKLETETSLVQLMSKELNDKNLHQILNIFEKRLFLIEKWIAPQFKEYFPEYQLDTRYSSLNRDLVNNGLSVDNETGVARTLSKPEILGIIYVWEGSKLGAQFIYNSLVKNKSVSFQSFEFFNVDPADVRLNWSRFQKMLISNILNVDELQLLIAAANEEFQNLYEAFKSVELNGNK